MNVLSQREEEIFAGAQKLAEGASRIAFLDEACAGESALRARVEELLAVQGDAEKFFR